MNILTDERIRNIALKFEAAGDAEDAIREALACLPLPYLEPKLANAQGAPVAWIRFCSDGCYEGPIMDCAMEDVRKKSGAWTPLCAHPAPMPDATVESIMRQVDIVVANTQKLTEAGLNVQFAQGAYKELERQIADALRNMGRK